MKKCNFLLMALFIGLLIQSCSNDDNLSSGNEEKNARLSIDVTDAPIDNAEVQACFVTISEIYLDGVEVEGFTSTTVDLLAYQNGDTYKLGDFNVDAKSYSSIDLKLTPESNNNNVHPHGCYILDSDGNAHALLANETIVTLASDIETSESSNTNLVLDFDLRKCIKKEESNNDNYDFVSRTKLETAIRVSSKEDSHIKGECSSVVDYSDEIIVYVYNKGEFNAETEMKVDSETNLQFTNAVSSSKVDSNNKFQLSFLQEGEYELHFYGYDEDEKGQLEMKGKLQVQSQTNLLNLTNLEISSQSNLDLSLLILGIG
ncbi:MAG: DUF4382 domain-containing protein [Saprospiraceae bacterium]|nr:DUF4382 domain-containing protein [Bacteroidia bacterium]NNE16755.1 DUF4382 domain-containing protein [Saprospiraceae bacterium]NNL92330.1 DUF4382 domain-containing protein [Saprospiraceae bacterium]